ncbi:DNRLRE domain-containing protein [Streptomyces sp. NEAU-sy36]|uniref:DNRLRE domain-containing protein n=1 Tax=unclassified Streptomyces TaxID=2593676 RepID=UPI0015D63898|nr:MULTISPECIES: DNRLRE domain-containing protein [unclassified Streptomyces]QLJ02780.1 DNRLRE domain-containing protein [Streptomyces sp. NEAU-sy36]
MKNHRRAAGRTPLRIRATVAAVATAAFAALALAAPGDGTAPAQAGAARTGASDAKVSTAYTTPAGLSPIVQSGPRNIITRVQDTYVSSTDARDHSTGAVLHIGTPDNGATKYRSYLKFDVSKLHGASIKSAKLRLYDSYTGSCDGWWMYADPVSASWDQSTITWANKPGVTAGYQASANFGIGHPDCPDVPNRTDPDQSNGLRRIDVTSMVNAWAQGTLPNYGMQLSAGELDSKAYKDFCSMNPDSADYACNIGYYTPTLEVEFNAGATALMAGDNYAVDYGGYPATSPALEFYDSTKPSVWSASGPYQRWVPDAYHSILDSSLVSGTSTVPGGTFGGGTEFKLRPTGVYRSSGALSSQLMVVGDGNSGFIGVIPFPALSGYRWAINVGHNVNMHGVELLPNGSVAVAEVGTGSVRLYTAAQGAPGNGPSAWQTPYDSQPLAGAHQVLWDDTMSSLWAIGDSELVRYSLTADGKLHRENSYALPKNGTSLAYGHDISPVYGNPDRLWVSANAGEVQFSKSGQSACYTSSRWPTTGELGPDASHWCTDYPYESQVNRYSMVKSAGNDPVTGQVATICLQRDPNKTDNCHASVGSENWRDWTTPVIDFVDANGRKSYSWSEGFAAYYRVRWLVPSYT